MPWLTPETKKPGGLEPTGPYSLTSLTSPLASASYGRTSVAVTPPKGAWMVSASYHGDHSRVASPGNPAAPPSPGRLTPQQKDDLISAVREWWGAGCHVHPCTPDGSKKAVSVEGGSNRRDERGNYGYGFGRIRDGELPRFSLEQMERMIRAGQTDGIGVFCGWQSGGLEMVEVEGRAAHLLEQVKQAAVEKGCLHLFERLGAGCVEQSAGGGYHFVLRVEGGPALPDQILAQRLDENGNVVILAETSGQSQWFVAAPSAGRTHKSGKPYRFVRGGPATIPTFSPEERDLIYTCFRVIDEMPKQEPITVISRPRRPRRPGGQLTPGEDFNVRGWSWEKIVTGCPEPWRPNGEASQQQQEDGTLVEYRELTRPGKTSGTSATIIGGFLRCFTSSSRLPKYESPARRGESGKNALTKYAAYAHLYHKPDGGPDDEPDWAAASRALAELGFGSDALDDVEPAVVETLPDRGPARDLDDWRLEMRVERSLALRMPGLHLDRSQTGSGKTTATTTAIRDALEATKREAEHDDSVRPLRRTLTALPDHANIRERVEELREAGIPAVAYPARDETTCGNLEAVRRAESLGLIAGAAVCWNCPLRDSCLYMKQTKEAEKADHALCTHERLRLSPGRTAGDRDAVVIDEMPESVLAPSITVRVDDFAPVVALASTVRDEWLFRRGRVMEAGEEERAFSARLVEAHDLIVEAARRATEPGVVEIDLPPAAEVPKNWQTTILRWAVEAGVSPGHDRRKQERFQKALRLLTMIVTGGLERLHLLVDQTSRHKKQADGTVEETEHLHHFVVGSWKTRLPNVPILCLDATADADGLRAATGREVRDCTPEGYLPNVAPVVQVPWDVTAAQSPSTAAGFVEAFLTAHPEIERLGLIGHQDHVRAMMADDRVLPPRLRARLAKVCYYGQGPDRASNDWHEACDGMMILGTMRPGGGPVKERLVLHGKTDAARRSGDWGIRHWEAVATDGRTIRVEGKGYRDPDWHAAHVSISRAAVHQAAGRGRAITEKGIPVWIVSDEPMGCPVDDSLEPVSPVVREAVEAVRAVRDGGEGTSLFPIRDTYRKKSGSLTLVRVSAVVEYLQVTAGRKLGKSGAEKRLRLARRHGRLEAPEKGWLIVVGDEPSAPPVAAPDAPESVARPSTPPPAMLTRPPHGTVITATGPAAPIQTLDVAARPTPETTTAVCTSTAPSALPAADDPLLEQVEERAAILEFDAGYPRETAERLALEMVMGRGVRAADAVAETVGVDHGVLAARFHPLVDHAVRTFGGTVRLLSPEEDPFSTGWGVKEASAPRQAGGGCRCGATEWVDVPIHGGRSARRECAGCGKFVTFSLWYGRWSDGCAPSAGPPAGSSALALPPASTATTPGSTLFLAAPIPAVSAA